MIKVNNLLVKYKSLIALNIKELEFEEGIAYGIVGENGAGKTTLFKSISNIIANYSGTVEMDGKLVKKNNEVLAKLGLVLDGMSVYKDRTGWFNIKYFAGLRDCFDEQYATELAQELDIYQVLDKKVKTYSYGMQKKLILLIAILSKPKYLILDEPFRGLDFDTVKWFKAYLLKLREEGTTLLISSHVKHDLEELCQKVHVIHKGELIEHFDLEKEATQLIRVIDTSNNERTKEIMKDLMFTFEEFEGKIRASISQDTWSSVETKLREEGISVLEISKSTSLDGRMN